MAKQIDDLTARLIAGLIRAQQLVVIGLIAADPQRQAALEYVLESGLEQLRANAPEAVPIEHVLPTVRSARRKGGRPPGRRPRVDFAVPSWLRVIQGTAFLPPPGSPRKGA